jgi:hypothetical protein
MLGLARTFALNTVESLRERVNWYVPLMPHRIWPTRNMVVGVGKHDCSAEDCEKFKYSGGACRYRMRARALAPHFAFRNIDISVEPSVSS